MMGLYDGAGWAGWLVTVAAMAGLCVLVTFAVEPLGGLVLLVLPERTPD